MFLVKVKSHRSFLALGLVVASLVVLTVSGCGSGGTPSGSGPGAVSGYPGQSFTGKVMAGSQPVVGATVQAYAAGTSGNGSTPTSLMTTTLTTDATGAFTVPASYSCPSATSMVYVVAHGGKVGTGSANATIVLVDAIGACNGITSAEKFTVNEVTTAASAWALSQFLSAGGNVGASSTNARGLSNAFATTASLADPSAGTSPGSAFPSNGSSPAARINTLANLLNTCVAATASSTACTQLFAAATVSGSTAPSNTLDAALNLVRNPGSNVATLYSLSTASTAFQPALTSAPADWTLFVNFNGGGMNEPTGIAADSSGNIWVANYFNAASEFSPTGKPLFANGITGSGLNSSYGLAIDSLDNVWVPNENSPYAVNTALGTVTELNSSGQPVSGATGFSSGGLNYPVSIAIDTNSTAWVVDYGNSRVTLLSSTGQPLSGTSGYIPPSGADSGLAFPVAVAIDGNHNGWIANEGGDYLTRISADGKQFTNIHCCDSPQGLAIDQRGYIWASNFYGDSISEISSSTNAVVSSGYTGGGVVHPVGLSIDGAGNVWVANFRGNSLSELAGSASSAPGKALSPAAGWAPDAALLEAYGIAIDASGNVWVSNFGNNSITEFVGLAVPIKTPVIGLPQLP
ncbi:NHL repeat-containing protein [Edaphobacter bradus]|uniref:NHL repeat-containing protein n=1 Tax=Edaphobacter bradus TaxID=2259016 RepID=UPI0021E03164|nr:NHL repeat-containing protein [Edaphobacter bradus]